MDDLDQKQKDELIEAFMKGLGIKKFVGGAVLEDGRLGRIAFNTDLISRGGLTDYLVRSHNMEMIAHLTDKPKEPTK